MITTILTLVYITTNEALNIIVDLSWYWTMQDIINSDEKIEQEMQPKSTIKNQALTIFLIIFTFSTLKKCILILIDALN